MDLSFFQNSDIYSWQIISILILAGFVVGVINTLAGNGTAITYTLFLFLGLDTYMANGTPRLGVVLQTLVASLVFNKKHILDIKKGIYLGIPVVIGSLIGAEIAVELNEAVLKRVIAILMLAILIFIFYKPKRWLQGKESKRQAPAWLEWIIFLGIGVYGGFIHIGVGILLLSGLVLISGYDLVKANALKIFIVMLYTPFALTVFMINGQVEYHIGLIAAIGNLFGGFVASLLAVKKGGKLIQWVLVTVILISAAHSFGIINFPTP